MAQSQKTSQGGASLLSNVQLHHPWRQCSLYSLNLQFDNGGGSSHSCPPLDCLKKWQSHAIILTDSMSLLQKVKSGMCQWSTTTYENSCGCIALDKLEWWEMTEQIDWQAKQPISKATLRKLLRWGRMHMGFSERIDTILNWTSSCCHFCYIYSYKFTFTQHSVFFTQIKKKIHMKVKSVKQFYKKKSVKLFCCLQVIIHCYF